MVEAAEREQVGSSRRAGILKVLDVVGFNEALAVFGQGNVCVRGSHLRDLMIAEARLTVPGIVVLLQPHNLVELLNGAAKVVGRRSGPGSWGPGSPL